MLKRRLPCFKLFSLASLEDEAISWVLIARSPRKEVVHNSMWFLLIAIYCDLAVSNSHGISWRSLPLTKACFLWLTFSSATGIPHGNTHTTYIHALNRSFSTIRERIHYRSQITIYCILCTKQLLICCLISL